jgi:hypothetical protein
MNPKPYCFSCHTEQTVAFYFGLEVEVLEKLENCSLIRRGEREFVVDTQDLVFRQARKAGA